MACDGAASKCMHELLQIGPRTALSTLCADSMQEVYGQGGAPPEGLAQWWPGKA